MLPGGAQPNPGRIAGASDTLYTARGLQRRGLNTVSKIRKPKPVSVRPAHVRDSPRTGRLTESMGRWRLVESVSSVSTDGRLSPEAHAQLTQAIGTRRGRGIPLVIRNLTIKKGKAEIESSWARTVRHDTGSYQVNEGVRTDRVDGGSSHCPGLMRLHRIWTEARRMEVGLKDKERGHANPVLAWVQRQGQLEPSLEPVEQLLGQLKDMLCSARKRSTMREPAFVAGTIQPGGGPTHFDNYENLAVVLVGQKTFYLAEPSTFRDSPRLGKANERLGVSPHDRLSSRVEQWHVAHLEVGDILYLPLGWWHFVDSVPRTGMANTWAS